MTGAGAGGGRCRGVVVKEGLEELRPDAAIDDEIAGYTSKHCVLVVLASHTSERQRHNSNSSAQFMREET